MQNQRGFTVIELLAVVVLLFGSGYLVLRERSNIDSIQRDLDRKTAINAMYYSLEEVYYKTHGFYPRTIDASVLPSMDPALFTDPDDMKLGESESNYHYDPINCDGDACKSYTLRADLEKESQLTKKSLH